MDIPALPFCRAHLAAQRPALGYPNELNSLADHLERRRLELGLRWNELAAEFGLDAMNLGNWRKGRRLPSVRQWPKIIDFLGYDPRPAARDFAERLIQLRTSKGVSQRALAERLGLNPSTVARWEAGRRMPTRSLRERVEAFLPLV